MCAATHGGVISPYAALEPQDLDDIVEYILNLPPRRERHRQVAQRLPSAALTCAAVATAQVRRCPECVACGCCSRWGPVRTHRRCRPMPRCCRRRCPSGCRRPASTRDIAAKTLPKRLVEFTPANVLWSDGADEARAGIQLPAGREDRLVRHEPLGFPVGTKFFKEFSLDGKRLETRLIWRVADTGNRERDTLVGAYVWNDDETEAVFVEGRCAEHARHRARCAGGRHVLALSRRRAGPHPRGVGAADSATSARCRCRRRRRRARRSRRRTPRSATCTRTAATATTPNGGAWSDSHMILRLDVDEHDATANQIVQTTVGVDARAVDRSRLHETDRCGRSRRRARCSTA